MSRYFQPERRSETVLLKLTVTELNFLNDFQKKRQSTQWRKVGRTDAILSAIRYATGDQLSDVWPKPVETELK